MIRPETSKHLAKQYYFLFMKSLLFYLGGLTWFILLSHVQFSERCYFSENALLPGLVESEFLSSEEKIHNLNLDIVNSNSENSEELQQIMSNVGLEVYTQKFSFKEGFAGSKMPVLKNGTNVYGIVRAPRSASTECIVINIPISKDKHNFAVGAVLMLAKHMRTKLYWAKDLVFLFSEHGLHGARAWLNSYHGIASPHVSANQLPARAGSIQAAFSLLMEEDAVSYVNIMVEGYNGQLPNLDLFNLIVRLTAMERIAAAVNHKTFNAQGANGLQERFDATFSMMRQQASGATSGNHGEFLRHGIEAVTLQTVYLPHWGNGGYIRFTRIIEGTIRSLNNLLERFHQSFFFYLLPSTENYISIGMYMPALGLILAAAVLKALPVILKPLLKQLDKNRPETSSSSADDNKVEEVDEMPEDFFSDLPDAKDVEASPLKQVTLAMLLNHVVGIALLSSPTFTRTWSQMFDFPEPVSVTLLLVTVQLAGVVVARSHRLSADAANSLYVLALLQVAIVCGTTAIINFSLGMFLAAYFVPITLFLQPGSHRYKILQRILAITLHPAIIVAMLTLWSSYSDTLDVDHVTQRFVQLHVDAYEQYESGQSWLFAFTAALVYPASLHFASVVWR